MVVHVTLESSKFISNLNGEGVDKIIEYIRQEYLDFNPTYEWDLEDIQQIISHMIRKGLLKAIELI